MALVTDRFNRYDAQHYSRIARTGTRTAGDFTVNLGFFPTVVKVTNATDRVSVEWHGNVPGMGNTAQLVRAANGDTTLADGGVAVTDQQISVTVATAGLETDNDIVLVEAWD